MKKLLMLSLVTIFIPYFASAATCDKLANKTDALYSKYQDYSVELVKLTERYNAERASYLSTGTSGVGQGNADRLYYEYISDYNQIVVEQKQTAIEYDSTVIEYNTCIQQEAVDNYEDYLKEQERLKIEAEREWQQSQRETMVTQAVLNCDLGFFENEMTSDERMNTWDERQACNDKLESINESVTVEPNKNIVNEVLTPPVTTKNVSDTGTPESRSASFEAEIVQNLTPENEVIESNFVTSVAESEEVGLGSTDSKVESLYDTENQPESFFRRVWKTVVSWFDW